MVNNFQEVITSLQSEINQSLIELQVGKPRSNQRYILERAACDMLRTISAKTETANKRKASSKLI